MICGLDGADAITGAGGNDTICGGDGADSLNGGGGNDTLIGDAGTDTLTCGTGTDTISYRTEPTTGVIVDLQTGQAPDTLTDSLSCENVIGMVFDDILIGNTRATRSPAWPAAMVSKGTAAPIPCNGGIPPPPIDGECDIGRVSCESVSSWEI